MVEVHIRVYGPLAELTGLKETVIDLPPGTSVKQALSTFLEKFPKLKSRLEEWGVSLIVLDDNGKRLDPNDEINGSLLHLILPPSGGNDITAEIVSGDQDPERLIRELLESLRPEGEESDVGAVLVFVGVVRGLNKGGKVSTLIYQDAGDLTRRKARQLVEEILEKYEGVRGAGFYHYTGERRPGDVTMIVGVSGVSRSDVFPALQELIEKIKHELPIWKKEVREDGTYYIIGDRYIKKPEDQGSR